MLAAEVTDLQTVTVRIYQNAGRNRGCDTAGFLADLFLFPTLAPLEIHSEVTTNSLQIIPSPDGKVPFNIFTATVV